MHIYFLLAAAIIAAVVIIGLITSYEAAPKPRVRPQPPSVPRPRPAPVTAKSASPAMTHPTRRQVASGDDLLAIVGFNSRAYVVLPPTPMSETGIRRRIDELPSPQRFKGGTTNLAAGLAQAIPFLEKSHGRVRRIVLISDGLPTEGDHDPLVARAVASRISICSIFCGTGNSAVLQSIADKTIGGWHTTASKMEDLATAIRRAGGGSQHMQRIARKKGIVVLVVDMSGSMTSLMSSGDMSRIEATRRAAHSLLDWHAATYAKKVAA